MPLEAASGLFRSEDVELLDLTIPREGAAAVVREVGRLSAAQFVDLNEDLAAFHRPYTASVRRAEALERSLRFMRDELQLAGLTTATIDVESRLARHTAMPLDALENVINASEADLKVSSDQVKSFVRERNRAVQFLAALLSPQSFIPTGAVPVMDAESEREPSAFSRVHGDEDRTGQLRAAIVVMPTEKVYLVKQLAIRLSRGNVLIKDASIIAGGSGTGFVEGDEDSYARIIESARSGRSTPDGTVQVALPGGLPVPVDEKTLLPTPMSVVSVIFSAAGLVSPFRRLFVSFGGEMFPVPRTLEAKQQAVRELLMGLQKIDSALGIGMQAQQAQLAELRKLVPSWAADIAADKAISMQLACFRHHGTTAKARLWVPTRHVDEVGVAFEKAMHSVSSTLGVLVEKVDWRHPVESVDGAGAPIPPPGTPPTWFQTNKYTQPFQNIVDAYGPPRYKEANPAVPTIITFPFLFGIMFGDMGHGVMATILAAMLVLREKKLASSRSEMFQMVFGARYLLLLMGICATYSGLLYNDCFSLGLQLFGPSRFINVDKGGATVPYNPWGPRADLLERHAELLQSSPAGIKKADKLLDNAGGSKGAAEFRKGGGLMSGTLPHDYSPYPFGMDPAWTVSVNKLDFYNSMKMKQAVIIGVLHMLLGTFFAGLNHIRNKDVLRFFTMFIPEVLFMVCTFGYMDLLIIVKWLVPGDAPPLLDTMTAFFLQPGQVPNSAIGMKPLIPFQYSIQAVLLLIVVVCIPILLCGVPCADYRRRSRKPKVHANHAARRRHDMEDAYDEDEQELQPLTAAVAPEPKEMEDAPADPHGHGDMEFSEVVILQMIHTIEYVLGCVSNTASYLRLWALSLAHAQLSEVFWSFTLGGAFVSTATSNPVVGGVVLFCMFAIWICVTLGVLLGMEGLSAFLHALRLHWVEFQVRYHVLCFMLSSAVSNVGAGALEFAFCGWVRPRRVYVGAEVYVYFLSLSTQLYIVFRKIHFRISSMRLMVCCWCPSPWPRRRSQPSTRCPCMRCDS